MTFRQRRRRKELGFKVLGTNRKRRVMGNINKASKKNIKMKTVRMCLIALS